MMRCDVNLCGPLTLWLPRIQAYCTVSGLGGKGGGGGGGFLVPQPHYKTRSTIQYIYMHVYTMYIMVNGRIMFEIHWK